MEHPTGDSHGARYVVVFDCESDSSFASLPGEHHDDKLRYMQFTVICATLLPCEPIENRAPIDQIMSKAVRRTWWRDVAEEGSNPIVSLLEAFDGAEAIVGYNCLSFDFPLIRRFYRPTEAHVNPVQRYVDHRSKTVDLMHRFKDATGSYFKLDEVLKRNGLRSKSSNGLEAINMWQRGDRDSLQSYCETDVALTAQLSLLENVMLHDSVRITNACFGVRSALAQQRGYARAEEEDSFVLV